MLVGLALFEVAAHILDVSREFVPHTPGRLAEPGKLVHAAVKAFAKLLIAQRLHVHADDGELIRHAPVLREVKQRRYQLAPRQVAAAAEDHENGGFQLAFGIHGVSP